VNGDFARYLNRMAILMLVACSITACGRKGSLEPPPRANAVQTPGEKATASNETGANADQQASPPASPTGTLSSLRAKKPPPILPPKTPFILDPLLQ
jgi:predicted small lipoprotein YifL